MLKICLVSMPFANLNTPSIALTQIREVTQARFSGQVSVDIAYLTHDFGQYLGVDAYNYISYSLQALYAGLGDWFFRPVAFPELPDNTAGYLQRFFPRKDPDVERFKALIAHKRPKLDEYMELLIARYALDKADIVGFTSMFMQNVASFAMARKVKQRKPGVITVMGGANCEFPMGGVIARRATHIDVVFSGPALKSFPEFVQRCLDGDTSGRAIKGVFSKDVDGSRPAHDCLGEELSIDVPIKLDYDAFIQSYNAYFPRARVKPVVPIETSRGCWWGERAHCTFCGLNGATMAYRSMKPELAIEQFTSAFRYRGKASVIESVDNILPKSYIEQVLPFIDTPEDMEIWYEVKADLSRRDMAVLARARVKKIQPGIESLATSTLKLMKKGTSACQNILFLKNCAVFDIKPYWNLLIGFPGEGADVYRRYTEVLPLLTHLTPPSGVFTVRFDRFGPYHKQAVSYGLDLHPMDFYSWVYPFGEADLRDFAYYFVDRNWRAEYVQAAAQWIGKLQPLVRRWQERWATASPGSQSPSLSFKDCSDVVCDSRDGRETIRPVGALGKAILSRAAAPVRIDALMAAFSPVHGADASRTLTLLEEQGLLFREGDRVISLVFGAEQEAYAEADAPHPLPNKSGSTRFLPMIAS